jgi:ZIP family zinc transporter
MRDYLIALALTAMPALGNFAGGLLAEVAGVSRRALSLALHSAAGIIFAVVAVELMPQAIRIERPWMAVAAFAAGGAFFVAMDRAIDLVKERFGGGGSAGPWMIYFGVAIDLFSDGLMIGTGTTIGLGLGLLLALGQVPADIPEGFATIATFREKGVSRRTRLLMAASFAVPILLGTTVGFWAVRGQPEWVKMVLLAFTAGVMLSVAVEEMLTEAHRGGPDPAWATPCLVGGFSLFTLISVYFD